jgi:predicted Ser/Thr protein kinase
MRDAMAVRAAEIKADQKIFGDKVNEAIAYLRERGYTKKFVQSALQGKIWYGCGDD